MNVSLQALGWTLIHFCWEATAIAALYVVVDLWLREKRAQARYLVALAALSLMFLSFALTLGHETVYSPVPLMAPSHAAPSGETAGSIQTVISKVESMASAPATRQWTSLLPWLDGMWLLGVTVLSIRSVRGWLWLQRLRRVTIEEAPEAIQASFEKVCDALGVVRLPELRMSQLVSGPVTIGVLRTLVLLPTSALLALSPEQLEAVFAHELAHIRRADYFWNLVQTLAETLFFFHPAVWWLGKRLREQRELCCDDIAIETCADPLVYATALFRLEDQRAAGLNLAMALDGHQSSLSFRSRILRILGEKVPGSQPGRFRPLSLVAVCASLLFFFSPVPKALGVAAQAVPVKQILSMPAAVAQATKNLSLRVTHDVSSPKMGRAQGAALQNTTRSSVTGQPAAQKTPASSGLEFEQQMRSVGYDLNQSQCIVLQDAGITPSYAEEMAGLGFGKPSVGTLLQMKKQDITRQYVASMRTAGFAPRGFDALVAYRLFNITPEFVAGMKAAGFDSIPPGKLQDLRAAGVTPEEARALKLRFPNATVRDLILSRTQQHAGWADSTVDGQSAHPPLYREPPPYVPTPHPRPHPGPRPTDQRTGPDSSIQ